MTVMLLPIKLKGPPALHLYLAVKVLEPDVRFVRWTTVAADPGSEYGDETPTLFESDAAIVVAPETAKLMYPVLTPELFCVNVKDMNTSAEVPVLTVTEGPTVARSV